MNIMKDNFLEPIHLCGLKVHRLKFHHNILTIIIFLYFSSSCEKNKIGPEYKDIFGQWKIVSAVYDNKPYINQSLQKFDYLIFGNCKLTKKALDNPNTRCGGHLTDLINKNQSFAYKLYDKKYIDFGNFLKGSLNPTVEEVVSKIFIEKWEYKISNDTLILTRNIQNKDDIYGLVLKYKKLK